jgi:hypothetical protein
MGTLGRCNTLFYKIEKPTLSFAIGMYQVPEVPIVPKLCEIAFHR